MSRFKALTLKTLQAVDNNGTQLPKTVREIMDRWVLQMGFPVVTINTKTGEISQKHFLLDPDSVVERPSDFKYAIWPITPWKNMISNHE